MRSLALCIALVACASEPAPAPTAASAPPAGHAAAPAPAPSGDAPTAFACCADAALTAPMDAYLEAQAALAKDDDLGAKAALGKLAAAATDPKLAAVADAAKAAEAAADIQARREAFKAVSAPMVELAKASPGGDKKVAVAFCPMANASWLQTGGTIANPYYGSSMLTCGTFK